MEEALVSLRAAGGVGWDLTLGCSVEDGALPVLCSGRPLGADAEDGKGPALLEAVVRRE